MKAWHSAIVTWEKREIEKGNVGTPISKGPATPTSDKQKMRDWVNEIGGFEERHGLTIRDFTMIISRDLVDLVDQEFYKRYGVMKSTAQSLKEDRQ